jgi:hypothetical protein
MSARPVHHITRAVTTVTCPRATLITSIASERREPTQEQ